MDVTNIHSEFNLQKVPPVQLLHTWRQYKHISAHTYDDSSSYFAIDEMCVDYALMSWDWNEDDDDERHE